MPTTVVSRIGSNFPTNREFATVQNWITSLNGTNITAAGTDQIRRGECYNDSEFASTGAVADFSAVNVNTDATHYVELTTASGQSFRDNAGVRTNPLYYDATKGVGLSRTSAGGEAIIMSGNVPDCRISNIQAKTNTGWGAISANASNGLIENCLFYGGEASFGGGTSTFNNCVIINGLGSNGRILVFTAGTYTFNFCDIITPSGVTQAHVADYANAAVTATYRNCALFGATTDIAYRTAGPATISYTTCATDLTGTTGITGGLTYGSQFVSTTNNFQLLTGSGLRNTGTVVSGITTDISGFVRKTGAPPTAGPDIGAWEFGTAAAPTSKGFVKFGPFLGIAAAEEWLRRRKAQVRRDEG